jgi:hypothetical protein
MNRFYNKNSIININNNYKFFCTFCHIYLNVGENVVDDEMLVLALFIKYYRLLTDRFFGGVLYLDSVISQRCSRAISSNL